jgi:hypothetical protein
VFQAIDRWGAIGDSALDGQSVNAIVKRRCALAGLDPADFSAHGLRSGYLTEAAGRGVPLPEAMRQSRHRSVQQAATYYNEVEIERGGARVVSGKLVIPVAARRPKEWTSRPAASCSPRGRAGAERDLASPALRLGAMAIARRACRALTRARP